ncbi:hypothetical protein K402DRAFT_397678 [Aulographum hederae CBS 113979]|uniref:RNI-like protein n=1 Tax=Aulographum hederae CBS 113979 TaxID=1176131 RepID=A0A6G1GNA2_9PEZI|nr:hypothetical protein K402DRAFT_397678 [Aulographum hederae CBS 113979]
MIPLLPDDILHVLCDELAARRDYDTLFNCCSASKGLASPALTALYRTQHLSPIKSAGSEAVSLADQELITQKWSILWRSMIASGLGKTLFPYCRYIAVLDLRDFTNLLEDDRFRGALAKHFFSGELGKFNIPADTPSKTPSGRARMRRLNVVSIIDAVGELITKHSPLLEEITGEVLSSGLLRWIPRLPRLRSLTLRNGAALEDANVASLIKKHCPFFNQIGIYNWTGTDTDAKLATFLNSLRPNSLRVFETFSDAGVGPETFLALSGHGESLNELNLELRSDILPSLAFLKGCTSLEVLTLVDLHGITDLESTQNDVFLETVDWLRQCKNLKRLSFTKFPSAVAITTPILLQDSIKLERLELDMYTLKDHVDFSMALANQKSLRSLLLRGDGDDAGGDALTALVNSLVELKELRELKLVFMMDPISDAEVIKMAESLPNLEDFYFGGYAISDAVLPSIAKLLNLRTVTLNAVTRLSLNGLLDFVASLDATAHQGISVVVDNADPDFALSDEEQNLVRESLVAKVGGRFEYTLFRDPDAGWGDSEDDSD